MAVRMNHRQYVRRRLNLVLLILVPGCFVTVAFYVLRQHLTPLQIYENGIQLNFVTTRRNYGGLFQALEASCTLAGLTGVFMILSAMKADRRLTLCGYRPLEIVAARLTQMFCVSIFISIVAVMVTALHFWAGRAEYVRTATVADGRLGRLPTESILSRLNESAQDVSHVRLTAHRVLKILIAVYLGAGIYAALGVFMGGLIRSQMEGSYVMFALPFTDIVIINTPIVSTALESPWAAFTPAYHPSRLLEAAAFAESFPSEHVTGGLCYLLLVSSLAVVAFRKMVRV